MTRGMDFRGRVRRFGVRSALEHAAWRRLHSVSGYAAYRCLELPVGVAPAAPPALAEAECREVGLREMADYADDAVYELDPGFIPQAIARGDCCMGVFAAGRLVSYSFNSGCAIGFHPVLRYRLPPGWIYHFKAFTVPAWRGRRLHALGVAAAVRKFATRPAYNGLATLVIEANHSSLRSFERLGFRVAHRFFVLRRESDSPWVFASAGSAHRVERVN